MDNGLTQGKARIAARLWKVLSVLCLVLSYYLVYRTVGIDLKLTTTLCLPLYFLLGFMLVVLLPLGLRTMYLAKKAGEQRLHTTFLLISCYLVVGAAGLGVIMLLEALGVIHL